MRMTLLVIAPLVVFLGAACSSSGTGALDAGSTDAGNDAGSTDAGLDAGSTDAGSDAGTHTGFPDETNTGVPAGTVLTDYTGPCTLTTDGTVIDGKKITCDLQIRASGVKVSRSLIIGDVNLDPDEYPTASFTLTDVTIEVGNVPGTGIGSGNFTATRVHVTGGNRSINCALKCTVEDSYVHGQMTDETGTYHESGIRMGQYSTIRHNTILCDAPDIPPDAGCSADLTGYGDFSPVEHNIIDHNFFRATTGGTCAYGGSSAGKPYSDDANDIHFTNNVFERGTRPSDHGEFVCGGYFPFTDFDENAPNNEWANNTFDDGTPL